MIRNLAEFLRWRGFSINNGPYHWARFFYKYTDCGPWVTFIVQEEPARRDRVPARKACFVKLKGRAVLTNPQDLDDALVSFLGYNKDGLSRKERTWKTYLKLVDEFVAERPKQQRTGRDFRVVERTSTTLVLRFPVYTEQVPAVTREIYYEDREVLAWRAWYKRCVGIKIGSIVEGSEVCWGPREFLFPFGGKAFDLACAEMEAETHFYWERDNLEWFHVRNRQGEIGWTLKYGWGNLIPHEEGEAVASRLSRAGLWLPYPPPASVRIPAERMVMDWSSQAQDGDYFEYGVENEIGDTGFKISRFINDEVY